MTSNSSINNINANELLVRFMSLKNGIFSEKEISYCNELMTGKLTQSTFQAVTEIMEALGKEKQSQHQPNLASDASEIEQSQPTAAKSLKRPLFSYPSTLTSKPSKPNTIRKNLKVKITKKPFQYLSYSKKPAPVFDLNQRVDIKRQKLDTTVKEEPAKEKTAKPQSGAAKVILDSLAPIDLLFGNVEPLPNPYMAKVPEFTPNKGNKSVSSSAESSPVKSSTKSPVRSIIPTTPGKSVLVTQPEPIKSKAAEILKFIVNDDEQEEIIQDAAPLFTFGNTAVPQTSNESIQDKPMIFKSPVTLKNDSPKHTIPKNPILPLVSKSKAKLPSHNVALPTFVEII
ncbi:hypothetical protein HDV01_002591 [Terramyces sp. JEL0728]|nr:hypothetical protein HDV01_002591 [Terramyces sp. JEL0728]